MKSLPFLLSAFLIFLQACAGAPTSGERGSMPLDQEVQAPAIVEPPVSNEVISGQANPGEVKVPELANIAAAEGKAPEVQPPKLCVILGPGMAKAMAEASVLEALVQAGIPVRCVVGSEMGAVVGALYALADGSTNTLQWELFKFNKDNYFNFPIFSISGEPRSTGAKLHDLLQDMFRGKNIDSLPVQFATVATDPSTGAAVNFREGDLADILNATLAMPGIFESWKVDDGRSFTSGAVSSPLPLDLAAALGANFLVVVNVIDDGTAPGIAKDDRFQKAFAPVRNLVLSQKKGVRELVDVQLPDINYNDFSHQGEILAAGKEAAEKEVDRIKADWEAVLAAFHAANPEIPSATTGQ